ncbi:hypothetical protein KFE98_16535 [bacterium SCSIO 12741]|nr:hypothetical protein KFE98_16535 [bacterium SCSIO 12741]
MKKILFGLLFLSIFTACETPSTNRSTAEMVPAINPPLGDVIPFTHWEVPADRDTTLELPTGSYVKVPAHSFQDSNGQLITEGRVQLSFREFNQASDVFLSGIPMIYKGQPFESAGMCEFKGMNGIQFAPGKQVEIGLQSSRADRDYNLYSLNESTGEWTDIGKDSVMEPESILDSLQETTYEPNYGSYQTLVEKVDEAPIVEPAKPLSKKDAAGYWVIQLQIEDLTIFPELSVYNGVEFKVLEGKQNNQDTNVTWFSADLENTNVEGQYQIHFMGYNRMGEAEERRYRVEPVYEGEDYDLAMKEYKKKFASYKREKVRQEKLAEERQRQFRLDSIKAANKWQADSARWAQERIRDSLARAEEQRKWREENPAEYGITRAFQVGNFGVFNCDRFYRPGAQKREVMVRFESAEGLDMKGMKYYLLDKGRNAVLSNLAHNWVNTITLYSGMDARVVVITADQQLAIPRNGERLMDAGPNEEVTLVLDFYDVRGKEEEEIQKLLL